jgi:hypothetical protein
MPSNTHQLLKKDSSSPSKDGGIEIIIVDNIRNIKTTPQHFFLLIL